MEQANVLEAGEDILTVAPDYKIYSEKAIYLSVFLTGPISGALLMAANFKALGRPTAAIVTLIGSIVVLLGVCLLMVAPFAANLPSLVYTAIYGVIAVFVTRQQLRQELEAHTALGGQQYSGGRIVLVSVIGLVLTLAIVIGMLYLLDPSLR